MNRAKPACLLGFAVLLSAAAPAQRPGERSRRAAAPAAQRQVPPAAFVRIDRSPDGEAQALQTAVVRMGPRDGDGELLVDLVAVIHYGEQAYYEALNRSFEQYDAVLYELVAPPGHEVPAPAGGDRASPLGLLQKMGQAVFGLQSQLDHIDYRRRNFVHADLSPQGMYEAMRKRGENELSLALGITADLIRQMNLEEQRLRQGSGRGGAAAADPLDSLLRPGGVAELKRSFAEELVRQSGTEGGLGRTLGAILIDDRNAAAMRVLQKQIAKGRKRIAIFYGAAHMPDFEGRLTREFGLERRRTGWFTAWDLRASGGSPLEGVLRVLLQEVGRELGRESGAGTGRTRPVPTPARSSPRRRQI